MAISTNINNYFFSRYNGPAASFQEWTYRGDHDHRPHLMPGIHILRQDRLDYLSALNSGRIHDTFQETGAWSVFLQFDLTNVSLLWYPDRLKRIEKQREKE